MNNFWCLWMNKVDLGRLTGTIITVWNNSLCKGYQTRIPTMLRQDLINIEGSDIWAYSSIDTDDDGHVIGSARTTEFNGGMTVSIGVHSYDYEQNGETKRNHVPIITVSDESGVIKLQPHARDSDNPRRAVQNAKNTAESVFNNPDGFDL